MSLILNIFSNNTQTVPSARTNSLLSMINTNKHALCWNVLILFLNIVFQPNNIDD